MISKYKIISAYLEEVSKEDLSKQTKAVEELLKDTISRFLPEYKNKVFIVGGSVRDKLLGKSPKDLDIVVDDPKAKLEGAKEFVHKLAKALGITSPNNPYPLKESYGIWALVLKYPKVEGERKPFVYNNTDISGYTIEVTPPRKEGPYDPKKRAPSYVEYTSLEEDAKRRDLTINSLYQNVVTGEIKDFTGGLRDLKNKVLSPSEHPEGIIKIYEEDPLRIFRIIRFHNKLNNFKINPKVEKILKQFINSPEGQKLIKSKVSPERIKEEFSKILTNPSGDKVIESIELLKECNLIPFISQKLSEVISKKWVNIKEVLKNSSSTLKGRLAALLHTEDQRTIEEILKDLRFPNAIIFSVTNIVKQKDIIEDEIDIAKIRKFIENIYDDLEEAIDFIKAIVKKDPKKYSEFLKLEKLIKEQKEKDISKGFIQGKKYIYPLTGEQIKKEIDISGPLLGKVKEKLKELLLKGHFEDLEEKEREEKARRLLSQLIKDEQNLSYILS